MMERENQKQSIAQINQIELLCTLTPFKALGEATHLIFSLQYVAWLISRFDFTATQWIEGRDIYLKHLVNHQS